MPYSQAKVRRVFYAVMPVFFQHFSWLPLRLFMDVFCRLEIRHRERVENYPGPVIFAMNHTSELDPVLLVSTLPFLSRHLPLYFVAREKSFYRKSQLRHFYGGRFFRMMGAYPAYPGLGDYEQALRHHIAAARAGHNICIFPVGKKHELTDAAAARGGVAYLAHVTGRPIVPVYFGGLAQRSAAQFFTFQSRLTITFGEPIFVTDVLAIDQPQPDHHEPYEQAAVAVMQHVAALAQSNT
jgi:1-acyl-sn-glycerol-3-phosphate acyltransferase